MFTVALTGCQAAVTTPWFPAWQFREVARLRNL